VRLTEDVSQSGVAEHGDRNSDDGDPGSAVHSLPFPAETAIDRKSKYNTVPCWDAPATVKEAYLIRPFVVQAQAEVQPKPHGNFVFVVFLPRQTDLRLPMILVSH
jgi:hypothetical protein